MLPLPAQIARLPDVIAPLLDPAPLRAAFDAWERPWRVAIVGRQGVGKSTLTNVLVGERVRPTGLGGVSSEPAEVTLADGTRIVDTVGIDDEVLALDHLQPLLEDVDGVVWIVDGLQPMTATERRVVEASLVPRTHLHIVVSKLDLTDPAEVDPVIERVRVLAAPLRPRSVRRLDLRGLREQPSELVTAGPPPTQRRVRPIRTALEALQAQLDALPATEGRATTLDRVRRRWAELVRRAERLVEERMGGAIEHKVEALAHLWVVADETRARFVVELAADPVLGRAGAPELPVPDRPDTAPLNKVIASMSGLEGARRMLRATAARWLAEGDLALLDWVEGIEGLDDAHQARVRVQDALSRARLAI